MQPPHRKAASFRYLDKCPHVTDEPIMCRSSGYKPPNLCNAEDLQLFMDSVKKTKQGSLGQEVDGEMVGLSSLDG